MALIQEYFSLLNNYKEKYGKTLLFMQVGSFIEVYSKTPDDDDMVQFTSICELKIANKPLGKDKIYMAGFRDYMLDKYVEKMVSKSNYTIVYYEQIEKAGIMVREEAGIYSPGTIFHTSETLSNNITCIWIHKTKLFSEHYIFGFTTLDIHSGTLYTNEYKVPYYHNPTTYDEIEKHISIYNPIETILIHNIEKNNVNDILQFINPKSKKTTVISLNDDSFFSEQARKCEYQSYQEELMDKYYKHMTVQSNLFNHIISFQSLCFLLNYVEQHNPTLIHKIKEPMIEQDDKRLILANHLLKQLNILETDQSSDHKYSCIMNLLNECKTKMGKRLFQYILVNPTRDATLLQESYDLTEHMIEHKYDWTRYFTKMKDMDYILRKNILKKCTPLDYYYMHDFCIQLNAIVDTLDETLMKHIDSRKTISIINDIKKTIEQFFNMHVINSVNSCAFEKFPEYINHLILSGNDATLDSMMEQKIESKDKLDAFIQTLEDIYKSLDKKSKSSVIKIHETSSGISLHITKRRCNLLLNHLTKPFDIEYISLNKKKVFQVDKLSKTDYNSTTCSLSGSFLHTITNQMYNESSTFLKQFNHVYQQFHNKINDLQHLIHVCKTLDMLHCKKEIAVKNNYSKPILEPKEHSFLDIKELRHPLIEKIETNELYVTNDVCMDKSGMLLYGTNAVGKTSFIKSIGIAVLMAQCGLYTPCKTMTFSPYQYIFTRIIGNDNIFKGLSTFGVEMSELRVILKYCNSNSLILGDELCSGTEIDSALSIFVSGLEKMYKLNSSFIFATHFHQIQHFSEIRDMPNLQLKHLTVEYNPKCNSLIYNRKLQDGAGESIYGLEVCKSLSMPTDFLDRAYEIRNKYDKSYNNILSYKTSKYNKDKLRGLCEFCKCNMSHEIHHLQYQKDFKDTQVHNKANLSCVCETCHDKIHSLGLVYERKKTLDGEYKLISKN
jgi:DNA mismatch repair protein MutS